MLSSLLGGYLLKSQPGLEESHPVPVDSPSVLGYTCISFRKDLRVFVFYFKMGLFKVAKMSVGLVTHFLPNTCFSRTAMGVKCRIYCAMCSYLCSI